MVDRGAFSKMNHDLSFVDEKVRSFAPVQQSRLLAPSFRPNNWTVLCGRGKSSYNHVGNRRFRILCELSESSYEKARSKTEKSLIVMNIVDAIREGSRGGGFVKQDPFTKEWFEVSDAVAREKVGQQLRENLSKKKPTTAKRAPSSKVSKRKRGTSAPSTQSNAAAAAQNDFEEGVTSSCDSSASDTDQEATNDDASGTEGSERSNKSQRRSKEDAAGRAAQATPEIVECQIPPRNPTHVSVHAAAARASMEANSSAAPNVFAEQLSTSHFSACDSLSTANCKLPGDLHRTTTGPIVDTIPLSDVLQLHRASTAPIIRRDDTSLADTFLYSSHLYSEDRFEV